MKNVLFYIARLGNWLYRSSMLVINIGFLNAFKVSILSHLQGNRIIRLKLRTGEFAFTAKMSGCFALYTQANAVINAGDKKIERVLDIGAYIGDTALLFSSQYPDAEICCIEASPGNFQLLKGNFENCDRVKTFNRAAFPESGAKLEVFNDTSNAMGYQTKLAAPGDASSSIDGITILEVMQLMQWETIDLLKIDIEGGELPLFTQNQELWIDKVNAFMFEIPDVDAQGATQAIFRALDGDDFEARITGECLLLYRKSLAWSIDFQRFVKLKN